MSRSMISKKYAVFVATCLLTSLLVACVSVFGPASNHGDEISERLALGMTKQDVESRLKDMTYLMRSEERFELPRGYIHFGARTEAIPADLLLTLPVGTEIWDYAYWVSSNDMNGVRVFFSDEGRVLGWTRFMSEKSWGKYEQERITGGLAEGMTDAEVVARIGPPKAIVPAPGRKDRTRELYADHFWSNHPTAATRPDMWVYSYELPDGKERHVYLLWDKTLCGWGYDRAHLEAERVLAAEAKQRRRQ